MLFLPKLIVAAMMFHLCQGTNWLGVSAPNQIHLFGLREMIRGVGKITTDEL